MTVIKVTCMNTFTVFLLTWKLCLHSLPCFICQRQTCLFTSQSPAPTWHLLPVLFFSLPSVWSPSLLILNSLNLFSCIFNLSLFIDATPQSINVFKVPHPKNIFPSPWYTLDQPCLSFLNVKLFHGTFSTCDSHSLFTQLTPEHCTLPRLCPQLSLPSK